MCRCTGSDIDAFFLVDLFDVGISGNTGISCNNIFERVPRAPGSLLGKCKDVLKSLSIHNQTVESIVALFFMLSMLPEMPSGEFIGLVSIKTKGTNMKERPRSLDVTYCNDAVLSKFIGCWSDSGLPWMLSKERDCEQ